VIQNKKVRGLINAGVSAKKIDPAADFTPLAYKRIEEYIELLEKAVLKSGNKLPDLIS